MYATYDDAVREYAYNVGRERREEAWILTDYDTWQPNPFYAGPKVPHPDSYESDSYDNDGGPLSDDEAEFLADVAAEDDDEELPW